MSVPPVPRSIETLEDPRVAVYRDVRGAGPGEREGLFLVEGRLGVRRLLTGSRFRARSLLVTPTALEALSDVVGKLDRRTDVFVARQDLLERVVGYPMHRGCLAAAERGAALEPEVLLGRAAGRRLLLVLEDVTNPDNVGGAFRNAWAFGASAVLLTPHCADPLSRKATRVSMGGTLFVPFAHLPAEAIPPRLRGAGFASVALVTDRSAPPIREVAARLAGAQRLALLVGTEGDGLGPATSASAGSRARIPMAPGVDSLNLATAAGIALHHFAEPGS